MTGYHPKQTITEGQGRLLECLWTRKGKSVTDTALDIGLSRDRVFMWRSRGEIPLNAVGYVARKLKVSVYALNYEEVTNLLGRGPKWEVVVKKSGLTKEQIEYVLSGTKPKTFKEIENKI